MSEARYATVMVICYLLVRKQWRGPIAPPQITKQGSGYDFEHHNNVLFNQFTPIPCKLQVLWENGLYNPMLNQLMLY